MDNRKLYRSRNDVMLAGVCAGLAKYFSMDPTVVRLIFVLLLLLGGNGILIYLILWIIMPQEPDVLPPMQTPPAQ